jgi:hypothetical protein
LYLRKYKEDFGVFKFCLYCLIPIYWIIRGIYRSQTEYWQFEYVVWVGFDENWKVTFVTKGEDEEFLKKKYNINKSIDRFLEKIHIL